MSPLPQHHDEAAANDSPVTVRARRVGLIAMACFVGCVLVLRLVSPALGSTSRMKEAELLDPSDETSQAGLGAAINALNVAARTRQDAGGTTTPSYIGTFQDAFGWFLADFTKPNWYLGDRGSSDEDWPPLEATATCRGQRSVALETVRLSNICVSARTTSAKGRHGALYANLEHLGGARAATTGTRGGSADGERQQPVLRLDGFEDERRAPLRGALFVHSHRHRHHARRQRQWIRRDDGALIVHPVLAQSDNFGHVLYRITALRRLRRQLARRRDMPEYRGNVTVLFLVTSQTGGSIHPTRSMYRMLAPALLFAPNSSSSPSNWIAAVEWSALSPVVPGESGSSGPPPLCTPTGFSHPDAWQSDHHQSSPHPRGGPDDDVPDLCFEAATVGWPPVHMYSGRYAHQRVLQQRATLPELRSVRRDLLLYAALPDRMTSGGEPSTVTAAAVADNDVDDEDVPPAGGGDVSSFERASSGRHDHHSLPPWITVVNRRGSRQLTNPEVLQRALGAKFDPTYVRYVDFGRKSLREQISLAASSRALIGVHGTALQWTLVMQPGSVLVEIQLPGFGCSSPGVNPPDRRECEYGPAGLVAQATHVVVRVTHESLQCQERTGSQQQQDDVPMVVDPVRQRCAVSVPSDTANSIAATVACSLAAGFEDSASGCGSMIS